MVHESVSFRVAHGFKYSVLESSSLGHSRSTSSLSMVKRSYQKKMNTDTSSKINKNKKFGSVEDGKFLNDDNHPLKDQIDDHRNQLFCNIELNGENLEAIGFDMDFTLAQYTEEFDLLAFEGAKANLINKLGYPDCVASVEYCNTDFRRGLVIDKSRGNILKIDRHRYVRKAYHGLTELSRDERKSTYLSHVSSFTESNYANIDTVFLLVDAALFAAIVDLKDKDPDLFNNKSYEQIYKDIRNAVDLCHRDGVIKDATMADPAKYIVYDENLVPMLQRIKDSGKKVFLLTNSMWEYTDKVMDFLIHGVDGSKNPKLKWKSLFDVVVVGARKPAFLLDDYLNMFHVDEDGSLRNIEDKDSINMDTLVLGDSTFQGGCWADLHNMMEISSGDRILYVGDHVYSDILRSKRTLGWRTCLIIPELEEELEITIQESEKAQEILNLRRLQYDLDEYMDILRQKLLLGSDVASKIKEAESKSADLKSKLYVLNEEYNAKFNPKWGQLFKAGHRESRFAKQVLDYACLYTSKASNFLFVSPNRAFRPVPQDLLSHERIDNSYGL